MRILFFRRLGFACKVADRWQQMRNFRDIVQKGITLALRCLQSFGKGPKDKEARQKNEARDAARAASAQAMRETCPARRFFGSKKIGCFVMCLRSAPVPSAQPVDGRG